MTTTPTATEAATTVEVEPILTATLPIPNAYAFRPGPRDLPGGLAGTFRGSCLAFVVRHPSAGTILVDTGFHPDAIASVRGDFGLRMGLMFAALRPAGAFDEQLRERGVEPEAIERVLMTHLHVDHTSGMRLLPNATFTVAREEWRAATARFSGGRGFVARHLPPEERIDRIDLAGHGEPHGPFARTVDLLGDGSVRLVATPGHTPGHLSVLVRTPGDRQALLVGDAAYALRNIHEQRLPLITASDRRSRESLREIGAFAERSPDAVLVPSHDPDAWRDLT